MIEKSDNAWNRRLAAASAVALFLMLWLHVGQFGFLIQHWMKVGTYAAPFLLLTYFATTSRKPELADPLFMAVILLVVYIVHQFEEHWIDLFGNEYAFYAYINGLVRSAVGSNDPDFVALTPGAIYVINTTLVWFVGVIAIVRAPYHLFPALALAGITLVNGVTHIVMGAVRLEYNPGLLTSLVLFVPVSVAFYRAVLARHPEKRQEIVVSIAWAVLAHVLMVGGMLATYVFETMPQRAYFSLLFVWSATPLLLCRPRRTA